MKSPAKTRFFQQGDKVWWNWGAHKAYGEIQKEYTEPIKRKIKETTVTRNATPENPAYLIVQESGQEVLKSASELHLLDNKK